MKRVQFFAMGMCLLAFGSCIKDAEILSAGPDQTTTADGNTSFVFKIGDAELTSKASGTVEDSGVHDQGITEEYAVNDVAIYMFDATGGELVYTFDLTGITETTGPDEDVAYYTSDKFNINEGRYNIFAVANGKSKYDGTDQAGFLDFVDDVTYSSAIYNSVPTDGFIMTNRASENLGVSISNDADIVVSIELERVVAKVAVSQNYDSFELKDTNDDVYATVKLHNYKLVNLPTEYYLYRHVAELASFSPLASYDVETNFCDVSDDNGYVIDPYFFSKVGDDVENFTNSDGYFAQFADDVADSDGWIEMKSAKNLSTNYCLENTLYVDAQQNGYTTGVVFSAVVEPGEILTATGTTENKSTPIYYCNYKFYDSIASLLARLDGKIYTLDGVEIDENTSTEDLAEINIVRISSYLCYYNYWIKHYDNDLAEDMGVMEFGVVRNNYYNVAVNSIADIGSGEPKIDKDEPDETLESITVDFSVLPWIVRNQTDIELN